jgi:GR25 family glycosyltransferase involved in LPS biosynthesis
MIDFYCIHKEGDEESKGPLTEAIESGKRFEINVIPRPGVYSNIEQLMKQDGLYINKAGAHKITRRGRGVLGCFLSHYFLWKHCVALNKPIGVMEYDAIFIKPLPNDILDQFTDYLNLDYTRHLYLGPKSPGSEYIKQINAEKNNPVTVEPLQERMKYGKHLFKYMNANHIKGAFGYIIKPSGAEKLIEASKLHGVLPADIQPNLAYIDMWYTTPSIVMLNPEGLTGRFGGSHTNHDRTT